MSHKAWRNNTNKADEAIILLELIIVLSKRGRNIMTRKLTVAADNRKVYDGMMSTIIKASNCTRDAGAKIT